MEKSINSLKSNSQYHFNFISSSKTYKSAEETGTGIENIMFTLDMLHNGHFFISKHKSSVLSTVTPLCFTAGFQEMHSW